MELWRKKQMEEAHQAAENSKNTYVSTGLLYYNKERRDSLLASAEKLCYSESAITKLRRCSEGKWNSDQVTADIIHDFESMEAFVKDRMPRWEKSWINCLGNFFKNEE